MKKLQKFLAALLCVCVVAGFMAPAASAVSVLTIINLTVDAPAVGKKPADTATVPSHAHSAVQKVEWSGQLDSSGAFMADTSYKVTVTMGIKAGADWKFSDKSITAKVNGEAADEVLWYANDKVEVIYTFPKLAAAKAPAVLTEADITLTAPETGKTPAATAAVPSGAGYAVKNVEWEGSLSGGKFKADTSYTAYITLGIKSGKNAIFADDAFDAYVNDYLIDEIVWNSSSELVIPVVFEKTAAAPVSSGGKAINAIYLTVDAPATGKTPAVTASLSAGSNGTVNSAVQSVRWSGKLDTDGTFMPRTSYTVTFTMGIKPGANYYFSDKANSITATVNGEEADEVLWYAEDKVEVIYTFPQFGTGTTLTTAHITLDAPAAGQKPAAAAKLPSTASTYVSNVRWEGALDSSGCFRAGTEYTAYLTLRVKDEFKDRKFSDKSFDAYVNGVLIDEVTRVSDREIVVPVMFEKTAGAPPKTDFTDVAPEDYFAAPVAWAVNNEITSGTGNNRFSPNDNCTQAQILTFLWRAAGSPEPQGTVEPEGFDGTEYYYRAALWAAEQGMVEGGFAPDELCTRAMAVTFMWKHAGSPAAAPASFTDVPAGADYARAVAWAVEKGVTSGVGGSRFAPGDVCSRGQIVTFLYRAFAN